MKRTMCIMMIVLLWCNSLVPSRALELHNIQSEYVYVYSFDKDAVLFEKNAHDKMYPGSMTKIMTTLVALEKINDLDESVTLDDRVFEGLFEAQASVAGYSPGDVASLRDLLYGVMLPSGADASRAIANYVAGSEADYVKLMNEKVNQLGLENTHFVNTSGLYEEEHYSTVKDIGMILKEAVKHDTFVELFNAESYRSAPTRKYPNGITFHSTRTAAIANAGLAPGLIEGSKTGFTLEGGLCMASTARSDGASYMVITGQAGTDVTSAQHIVDAYSVYKQLFAAFENKIIYRKHESISTFDVRFGEVEQVEAYVKEDVKVVSEKQSAGAKVTFSKETLTAPVLKDEKIATLTVSYEGEELRQVDLYALHEVPQDMTKYIHYWGKYVLAGIMAVVCVGLILLINNRKRLHKLKRR